MLEPLIYLCRGNICGKSSSFLSFHGSSLLSLILWVLFPLGIVRRYTAGSTDGRTAPFGFLYGLCGIRIRGIVW